VRRMDEWTSLRGEEAKEKGHTVLGRRGGTALIRQRLGPAEWLTDCVTGLWRIVWLYTLEGMSWVLLSQLEVRWVIVSVLREFVI
jgi:hypothetical protein